MEYGHTDARNTPRFTDGIIRSPDTQIKLDRPDPDPMGTR
jgi:hypothetical protein